MASSEKQRGILGVSSDVLRWLAGELMAEWQDLGRILGVSEGKIYDIKADNIKNEKEAKYQMLLCWKQTDGQKATNNNLAEALKEVERTDLSEKVQQEADKAVKRSEENEQAASCSERQQITKEPLLNQSAHGAGHIWTGEGEIDKTKKRSVEDEPLAQPTTSVLKRQRIIEEPYVKTSNVDKKTQFVTELRYKYKNLCSGIQPAPFLREKYDINNLFVESGIAFVEEQEGDKKQEQLIPLKNHMAIFTDRRVKSTRRIIDGEPGYGKSTLALQITHDWIHKTAPMNDVEILILLRLRQFKNVPTMYSAIKMFLLPRDSKLTEDDIENILESSYTVILLDGYDEYPDQRNNESDIALIIRGELLQNHEVVLITRTSCLPEDCSHDTKRIRLTGFDETAKDAYIRKVVATDCPDEADKIYKFLRKNPVPADLCKIPLFFAMISHMVHHHDRFYHLRTVTELFKHIIKCFHSHDQLKKAKLRQEEELDHNTLDEIALDGLIGNAQQISWSKNILRVKIGEQLYNQYVRIGIFLEEESYDYDAMEYKTETRLFHKLFVEWYAAHCFAKEAGRPELVFEPWPDYSSTHQATHGSKHEASASEKKNVLKSLNPHDVHYMYRYACGLNPDAALKIIEHLGKNQLYDKYTLLCITEWGGRLEKIENTVTSLCSRMISINDDDGLLLQKSTVELINFANDRKIHIATVRVRNCLDIGNHGRLRVKPSNLLLPVIDTLSMLVITEHGRKITEEEIDSIFQYSAMCPGLKDLSLNRCLIPRYIKVTESYMSVFRQKHIDVGWSPGGGHYLLNLKSGQWEWLTGTTLGTFDDKKLTPITDEGYQSAAEHVQEFAEKMRR